LLREVRIAGVASKIMLKGTLPTPYAILPSREKEGGMVDL